MILNFEFEKFILEELEGIGFYILKVNKDRKDFLLFK